MEKRTLLAVVVKVAQLLIDYCETDEDIEQVKKAIGEYIDFTKSLP